MPEDARGLVGFAFFTSEQESIANEAAVRAATSHLFNPTAVNAAFDSLDQAREAVQEAARNKAIRGGHQLPDPNDEIPEGYDFFF